jgi:hypothetical protein
MNADIEVKMSEDDDSERATIRIRSWGGISELRFRDFKLSGVASFSSLDIRRLLETIREAEKKRVDPDSKLIGSLDYVMDRIDYLDETQTRLYLQVEAEMPIASCGSVFLRPNLDDGPAAAAAR